MKTYLHFLKEGIVYCRVKIYAVFSAFLIVFSAPVDASLLSRKKVETLLVQDELPEKDFSSVFGKEFAYLTVVQDYNLDSPHLYQKPRRYGVLP